MTNKAKTNMSESSPSCKKNSVDKTFIEGKVLSVLKMMRKILSKLKLHLNLLQIKK